MYFSSTCDLIAVLAVWATLFLFLFIAILSLAGYNVNDPNVNVSDFVETARSITEMKGN